MFTLQRFLVLPLLLACGVGPAQLARAAEAVDDLPLLKAEQVYPELRVHLPLELIFSPAEMGLAYVLEQKRARIQVFNADPAQELKQEEFLDLSAVVGGNNNEEGLLGMALDPNFAANGHFYVYYSTARPRQGVLARYTLAQNNPRRGDPDSALILLQVDQPWGNHNGGAVVFGPSGMLYLGLGDGGSGGDPQGHGQNRATLLGSILRLDVSQASAAEPYRVPADNPFVGSDDGRDEIWAFGLRNPWRMAFDHQTGELWAADVGQNKMEEVNIIDRGGNYGWNVMEGTLLFRGSPTPAMIAPVFTYGHDLSIGGRSITGGLVYRGAAIPALRGAYLCADYVSGRLWAVRREGRHSRSRVVGEQMGKIASFGQDAQGELYLVDHGGRILILSPR